MIFKNLIIKQFNDNRLKLINFENRAEILVDLNTYERIKSISQKKSINNCSSSEIDLIKKLGNEIELTIIDGLSELQIFKGDFEYLDVDLTNFCNLTCKHCCFYRDGKPSNKLEIDFDILKKAIIETENLGMCKLKLSGGEPFTYYKINELLDFVSERKFYTKIMTNGLLIHKVLNRLNNKKISFIISLDGFKKSHEFLRGKGTFENTLKNIKLAVAYGFDVEVNMALYDNNINEIDDFFMFIKDVGAKRLNTQIIRPFGFAKKNLSDNLTFLENDNYLRKIHWRDLKWEISKIKDNTLFCFSCKPGLLIDYNANVYGCTYITEKPIKNLKNKDISKIFNDNLLDYPLYNISNSAECFNCELFKKLCSGGCRARAEKVSNSLNKCDYWIPYLLNHTKFNESQKTPIDFLTF